MKKAHTSLVKRADSHLALVVALSNQIKRALHDVGNRSRQKGIYKRRIHLARLFATECSHPLSHGEGIDV